MSQDATRASYDEMPYESHAFPQTHPDRLAMVGRLFGVATPNVETCRVLELGCGCGDNLVPMAYELPGAHFVGTDLSGKQIEIGRARVEELGLKNIELRAADIMSLGEGGSGGVGGEFDYIICHGVYSWVPPEVQRKILAICRANLAPCGVAYVSYNTYPGWHQWGMVREMMQYYTGQFGDAAERVAQGRALAEFLAKSNLVPQSTYAAILRAAAERWRAASDTYLYHEFLEEVNAPVYFHEFVRRAAEAGLGYLGDSYLASAIPPHLSAEARETLSRMSADYIEYEQYLDFLRDRTFRHSLLVRAETPAKRVPVLEAVEQMYAAADARPVSAVPDVASDAAEVFNGSHGTTLSTNNPLVKAALVELSLAWPGGVQLGELRKKVETRLAASGGGRAMRSALPEKPGTLAQSLLQAVVAGVAELRTYEPRWAHATTPFPVGSELARRQAQGGDMVVNLLHHQVKLVEWSQEVLLMLDGSRDRRFLVDELCGRLARGEIVLERADKEGGGGAALSPAELREGISGIVEEVLASLQRLALLVKTDGADAVNGS